MMNNTSKTNSTNNVSPLRYPGGKTRACKILDTILTTHFDVTQYTTLLSPFFGGGSFEFYVQNTHSLKIIANDKFTPLYNFWNTVKHNKHALCNELKRNTTITKQQFTQYRDTVMTTDDSLEQATLYFIINRCSFSGATLSGGFSQEASTKRYTMSSINRIETLAMTNVDIHNDDYEEFINKHHSDGSAIIMFLDPPYYLGDGSKLYGKNGDMHENFNHERLYNVLKSKRNWILTYNNNEHVRNMYKDYIILDVNWNYGMNKTKTSSEIVIISK